LMRLYLTTWKEDIPDLPPERDRERERERETY
jgi:hypothetical protein